MAISIDFKIPRSQFVFTSIVAVTKIAILKSSFILKIKLKNQKND
jgi:hypothetical protein